MTRFNIAHCRRCGAEFSPPMMGETSELCPQCREGSGQPAPAQRLPRRPSTAQLIRMFPATSILVGLNVAVWLVMVAKGVSPADPTTAQLFRWGADYGPQSLGDQPWRLLASCFIHAGFLHLLFNMWCLWSLGMFVERFLGRITYVVAYLLAGVGGAIASVWWHPFVKGVGASGAIFGLAGIMVTLMRSGRLSLPAEYLKHHSKSILAFIGYNLAFGFISPHIDNSAHLGGLVTGLFMGALLPVAGSEEGHNRRVLALGITAALVFGAFAYARSARAGLLAVAEGEEAMTLKQWDKAAAAFTKAIKSDPDLPDAYLDLGYLYVLQEKYTDAVPVLEKGTRLAPQNASGFHNLGLSYVQLDRFHEAEAPLTRAIRLDPKDSRAWFNLAVAYYGQGKIADARQAAEKVLAIDPDDQYAQEMLQRLPSKPGTADEKK